MASIYDVRDEMERERMNELAMARMMRPSCRRHYMRVSTPDGHIWVRIPKKERYMSNLPEDKSKFINAVKNAILHARQVTKREKHLDCRSERVGMFSVSLRRELRSAGFGAHYNSCCDTRNWLDAGVLNTDRAWSEALKYKSYFEVAMSLAGKQGDLNYSMNELDAMVALEQELAVQAKNINVEADKLLEGFKQLVVNM